MRSWRWSRGQRGGWGEGWGAQGQLERRQVETEDCSKSGRKVQTEGKTAGRGKGGRGGSGRLQLFQESKHRTVAKLESRSLVKFSIWCISRLKELMHLIVAV